MSICIFLNFILYIFFQMCLILNNCIFSSSSSASNSNNSAKRPHWHQGNFIENSQDMNLFRREREDRERREREERERREREKERETENRKRQEQEQRRRNAETFIQSTNTNPVPQKHLFSEPVQRHDEVRYTSWIKYTSCYYYGTAAKF